MVFCYNYLEQQKKRKMIFAVFLENNKGQKRRKRQEYRENMSENDVHCKAQTSVTNPK